jgi:hypothetical protein
LLTNSFFPLFKFLPSLQGKSVIHQQVLKGDAEMSAKKVGKNFSWKKKFFASSLLNGQPVELTFFSCWFANEKSL